MAGKKEERSLLMRVIRPILGWMTPYEQIDYLRRKKDSKRWELFRDALMRRWSNLNVICGLIMGAISTIVFSNFPLTRASFTLGIIALLSSLIAIGFGVGLIYVLGDARGSSLIVIDNRFPRLYLFALSIPEVWALISFAAFFADVSVIAWQSPSKGWIVKGGVALTVVALAGHLVAFGFLFREQDTAEFLIPDEEVFVTTSPKASKEGAQSQVQAQVEERRDTQATAVGNSSDSPNFGNKFGKGSGNKSGIGDKGKQTGSLDGGRNNNVNSTPSRNTNSFSSHTLVASSGLSPSPAVSPSTSSAIFERKPPMRARTVPDLGGYSGHNGMQRLTEEIFVPRPTGDVLGEPASESTG